MSVGAFGDARRGRAGLREGRGDGMRERRSGSAGRRHGERIAGNQRTDLSLVTGGRRILGYDNLGGWPVRSWYLSLGRICQEALPWVLLNAARGRNGPLRVVAASPRHERALRATG
jgi:hypothetical protein